jgi:hypothetical protein
MSDTREWMDSNYRRRLVWLLVLSIIAGFLFWPGLLIGGFSVSTSAMGVVAWVVFIWALPVLLAAIRCFVSWDIGLFGNRVVDTGTWVVPVFVLLGAVSLAQHMAGR